MNKMLSLIFLLIYALQSTADGNSDLVGWAVGRAGNGYGTILHTTNGGVDWVRQGSADVIENYGLCCVAAVDANTAWVVGENARGYSAIYHTTNAGVTWSRQGSLDTVGDVYLDKISACSRDVVWISGASGTVLRTVDGGRTWQNRSPAGYSNFLQGITALDADHAWAAGHKQDGYAPILCTTNGGLTWVRQSGGDATNIDNILSIGAADAQRLWAVGFRGVSEGMIICSTNGGATWTTQYNALYHANELYIVNTARVYVALDSFVVSTTNGGQSWEEVGTLSTAYATMGICAPDGSNAWAVSDNWGGGFIYYMAADGTNWVEQTPTNAVAGLSYVSFVRVPDASSTGTLKIETSPSNGVWSLNAPPSGYTGPLCGTGSISMAGVPAAYYRVSFSALAGFRTPSSQTVYVTPGQTSLITGLYLSRQLGDYDGDGKTDLVLYDSQSGRWLILLSGYAYQSVEFLFGGPGWAPLAGDFDGDGWYDPCVAQAGSGTWAALLSAGGYAFEQTVCGAVNFQPLRGDYDGDGKSDLAVYRSADSFWSIWCSASGYSQAAFLFGGAEWQAVPADYDGDGKTDPCVYNESSGIWQAMLSSRDYALSVLASGDLSAQPVPADYDGDRKTDPAVYDDATGLWTVFCSGNNYAPAKRFCGWPGFLPVAGDADGDDLADFIVYDPAAGLWIGLLSKSGYTSAEIQLGGGAFLPVW
jgi:photosystem II stability/assembly factor-like uncharacterized protein